MEKNLSKVQWLTVAEMAKQWAPALGIPEQVVTRELRYALFKLEKAKAGEGDWLSLHKPLDIPPPEDELPSEKTLISREFIEHFCDKELWALPSFWFDPRVQTGPSFPGRPSIMNAVREELRNLAEAGKLLPSLAQQARVLERWAEQSFPTKQTPKANSIENGVRTVYAVLKKEYADRHNAS